MEQPKIAETTPKALRYSQIDGFHELTKDIYAKLDSIHAVIGYILEKTKSLPEPISPEQIDKGEQTDDNLDARDASGSVLPN